ncbi:MAG: PilZ domain-containing protein [Deltaproteobacteria bacterium]|nr:PilZ domain-containing protein [Deltaproteobacteria bacterium]
MTADITTLKNIPDGKPVRVFLPLKNGPELYRAQCIYHKTTPPELTLLFKTGVLPIDDISDSRTSIISIDMGGPSLSLEAVIEKIENAQTLRMTVKKSISHEEMREFFRVDATTKIISKSFHTELFENQERSWSIEGMTIDISGNGVLAFFPQSPPSDKQVRLEITLPGAEVRTITVLAHQVRSVKLTDQRFEAAYHFDDISDEDRDEIIGCCLMIQRKLLRLKVEVKGS